VGEGVGWDSIGLGDFKLEILVESQCGHGWTLGSKSLFTDSAIVLVGQSVGTFLAWLFCVGVLGGLAVGSFSDLAVGFCIGVVNGLGNVKYLSDGEVMKRQFR